MTFNWVDVLLVLLVVVSAAAGWQRGVIFGMVDLVRWVVSWMAAILLYRPLSFLLGQILEMDEMWRAPLAFLLVLILFSICIYELGRRLLRRVPREVHTRRFNRILGVLPGAINGLVMAALLSALIYSMPLSDSIAKAAEESAIADGLVGFTDKLEEHLAPVFGPAIRQTLTKLVPPAPGSRESVDLHFRVTNARPAPDLEAEMLALVNQERIAHGLGPLEADPELTEVARAHSADMLARGYFSHYTPEGRDPFERMLGAGVRFRTAGENLALAPTVQIAHTGLMNSPGHRANILQPRFGRLGIGIMNAGRRGLMVSQEFRN